MIKDKIVFTSIPKILSLVLVIIILFSTTALTVFGENRETVSSGVVVSMGDSFSAGEGIEDYYGANSDLYKQFSSQDFVAHRSENSWPGMLKVGSQSMIKDENWFLVATSGAVTYDIGHAKGIDFHKKSVDITHIDIDPQIDIFDSDNLKNKDVEYVTISIGGNDANFAGIMTDAVVHGGYLTPAFLYVDLIKVMQFELDKIIENVGQVYKDIHKKAPNAHIIVVGYPKLLNKFGKGIVSTIPEATAINQAITVFNKKLSATVEECKKEMDITFISVEDEFDTHEAFSYNEWINGVVMLRDSDINSFSVKNGVFVSAASFHPNEKGAVKYAELVNKKIEEIEKTKKNPQKNNTLETKKSEESKKVLSPESAVNIYMANKGVWEFDSPYAPMQGYGYCLLDLDFDGVLELICSSNDGTGRFSHNKYYRINQDTYSVEEIHSASEETNESNYSGYDYYFRSAEYPKLLKNKSDNKMFYYCTDIIQVMAGEFGTLYGEMYLANDEIKCENLFYEYTLAKGIQGNNEEVKEFHFYDNGSDTKISEKQYNEKQDMFFKNNMDLNLNWTCVNGNDFDSASNNKQTQLLLDAYRSYSYDGFSFDKVSVYNIPTDAKKTSDKKEINIWKEIPDEFYFSSGAGAWRTVIEIEDDGSFVGEFSDSDMGMTGEDYPKGTQYICSFSGKFTKPEKATDFIYKMNLEKLDVKETPGKEYCKDGIKYVCWEPYGMDNAGDFYIYLPGTPMSDVDEVFLSWAHLYNYNGQELPDGFYGIYNIQGKEGFIAKDI